MSELPEVAYRDEDLLVLVKPGGLPTTAPDGGSCLVELAERLDPDAPRLHPTSRLDAPVTGLVTFARTKRATHALIEARAEGRYQRLYLGFSTRPPSPPEGRWQGTIGIDAAEPRRRLADAGRAQKLAHTDYALRDQADGLCLLHLRPRTGRTHQLRVHAEAAAVPLFGDVHYGGDKRYVRGDGRVVTAARVMLHCAALDLPKPGGGTLALRCPAPADMVRVWARAAGAEEALSLAGVEMS